MREESSHATAWAVGVVAAVLIYILSPPPVAWVLEKAGMGEPDWWEWVYAPLIMAYDKLEPVKKFYNAYNELIGVGL